MGGMELGKLLHQVGAMQQQMQQAQQELAKETVEASAGGGMVTVTANGAGELKAIRIDPKAIDPDDPELLADMVLAAVNEVLRSAHSLAESKLGGLAGGALGWRRQRPHAAEPARRGDVRDRERQRDRRVARRQDTRARPGRLLRRARAPYARRRAHRTRTCGRRPALLRNPARGLPGPAGARASYCCGAASRTRLAAGVLIPHPVVFGKCKSLQNP